jgi:hypothetical protein
MGLDLLLKSYAESIGQNFHSKWCVVCKVCVALLDGMDIFGVTKG